MAKNSRARFVVAGTALGLVMALLMAHDRTAWAEGLPLRAPHVVADRALSSLADGLGFKLHHISDSQNLATWSAMVEETLLMARRLGFPADTAVTAQRLGSRYAVVLEGDSVISGADPDRVLGRLFYALAHNDATPAASRSAAALAVLDQPLSAALVGLTSISVP